MSTETLRVIVVDGLDGQCCVPTKEAHHINFPEIRAECSTPLEAVARLAHQLEAYREGAQSTWHRETIESALVDVREFIHTLAQAHADVPEVVA